MTMKICDLSTPDNTVEILCDIATVVNVQTWTTTHVSGDGTYSAGNGNVYSTPVTSSNRRHHQLFLRSPQGVEYTVETTNLGLGVRPGHELTLLFGRARGTTVRVGLLNHVTYAHEAWTACMKDLVPRPAIAAVAAGAGLLGVVTLIATCQKAHGTGDGGILLALFLIMVAKVLAWITASTKRRRVAALSGQVDQVLANLRSQLQQTRAPLAAPMRPPAPLESVPATYGRAAP